MKRPFWIILFSVCTMTAFGQNNTIRFIHVGRQTKPIGTLTVTLESKIRPLGSVDSLFENVVRTDAGTYAEITSFIKKYHGFCFKKECASAEMGTFEILVSDKFYAYLNSNKSHLFFQDLMKDLQHGHYDDRVIEGLEHM